MALPLWLGLKREPFLIPYHTKLQAYRTCCEKDPRRVEVAEWTLSFTLLIVGTHILFYPEVISLSHMRLITSSLPPYVIAFVCTWVGVARVAFILCTPSTSICRARAVLAIISACIWLEMIIAFFNRFSGGTIPPGLDMMIIAQFIGDLWVVQRILTHATLLRRKGIIK